MACEKGYEEVLALPSAEWLVRPVLGSLRRAELIRRLRGRWFWGRGAEGRRPLQRLHSWLPLFGSGRLPLCECDLQGLHAGCLAGHLLSKAAFHEGVADLSGEPGREPCDLYALRAHPLRTGFLLAGILPLRSRRARNK